MLMAFLWRVVERLPLVKTVHLIRWMKVLTVQR